MMPAYLLHLVLLGMGDLLTPYERFEAMRRLDSGGQSLFTDRWFVLLGWSVIIVLILLLVVVHRLRIEKEKRLTERNYEEMLDRAQLTAAEREILDAIAVRTGFARTDAVFHHSDAFENGLARLMQDVFADGQNLAYRKKLQAAVYSIKEKLGFVKPKPVGQPRSVKEQSSRHIPVGSSVLLAPLGWDADKHVSGEVIANDAFEFIVRPEIPLACRVGQMWRVRYETGTVTWELEAITLAASEKGLELNHSERIRFVNRRRFPRVAVRKEAVVARLPLFCNAQDDQDMRPVFVDAQIQEMSGPSLRVQTTLNLAFNDRVLLIFELEAGRIVQDIGQVRDFRQSPLGRAVIIELVGLNDQAVAELLRVTNQLIGRAAGRAAEEEHEQTFAEVT